MDKSEYGHKKISNEQTGMNNDDLKILMEVYQKKELQGIKVPKNWDELSIREQKEWVATERARLLDQMEILRWWRIDLDNGKKIK